MGEEIATLPTVARNDRKKLGWAEAHRPFNGEAADYISAVQISRGGRSCTIPTTGKPPTRYWWFLLGRAEAHRPFNGEAADYISAVQISRGGRS